MAVRIEAHAEPIPGYRLIERLGGGGFGEVWKAEAPGGLHKAIKFVYGDLQQLGEEGHRAEQELKAMSRVKTVRHSYILSLERYDIIDGQLIIVMELADRNLWDRFKECRAQGHPGIPRDELLGYMDETAEALDLMNNQYQLQHLDIKPQNLFLMFNHVKVADFGLVKDLEGMKASVTGGVTPVYAAPETFDGWVSRFSDQYSLGIVYQELLTGQRPFSGTNVRQLVLQHLQATPNLSSLPASEQPIIARALAKNPDDRFPCCRDLVRALRSSGGGEAYASPPEPEVETWMPRPSGSAPGLPAVANPTGESAPPAPLSDSNLGTIRLSRSHEHAVKPLEMAAAASGESPRPAPPARPEVPPEQMGDGVLFPALIVAVGQVGLTVLQRVRHLLHDRFGNLGVLPHLRFLYLDTDPEVLRVATRGDPGAALSSQEILLAPLNRPTHYLKSVPGRLPITSWFNPRMLYRIPRTQVTLGARALGRLAFVDNYRAIARRLRSELETCLDPQALTDAQRFTGLGLRSNRPRVYVVTSLAGGTGGGMFLDLAYVVRQQLRQLGYTQPDLAALLMVPATDNRSRPAPQAPSHSGPPSRHRNSPPPQSAARDAAQTLALGNTVASLIELTWFASPDNTFFARYQENEPPLRDPEPPFNRTLVLPLTGEGDAETPPEAAVQASEFLARELCSPLGRAADLGRADQQAPPWPQRGLFYSSFGLHCLTSPHRALIQELAREMCADLVDRWMTKDATPVKDAAAEKATQAWEREGWTADAMSRQLLDLAENILGQPSEPAIASLLGPLLVQFRAGARDHIRDVRERDKVQPADVPHFQEAMQKIEALVGWPAKEETLGRSAVLPEGLRAGVDELVSHWGDRVASLVVRLIEEPGFRLAGAEEVVRQIVAKVEGALQQLEPRAVELANTVTDTYARIQTILAALARPAKGRPPVLIADVIELIRCYAQWRYEDLLRQQLVVAYVSLRGHWSDELREINYCRVRLKELQESFAEACVRRNKPGSHPGEVKSSRTGLAAMATARRSAQSILEGSSHLGRGSSSGALRDSYHGDGAGRRLFPAGCRSLEEAVEQYLDNVSSEDVAELDVQMQELLRRDFQALVHVCLTSANVLKDLELAMQQEAETFVAPRLAGTNPAELFLSQAGDDEAAKAEIVGVFDEAAPETAGKMLGQRAPEVTVLVTPPGPEGAHFTTLAQAALRDANLLAAPGDDDIVIYREVVHLPLADLEQLDAAGQEAYRQMTATNNFTPHTRTDIDFPGPGRS